GFPRHAGEEQQRALHGRRPLLFARCRRARQRRTARVAHEDIETSESLDGRRDQTFDRLGSVEISGEREDLASCLVLNLSRDARELGLAATAHGDPGAFLGEHLGAGSAQPLARSADDRHLVLELEIHRWPLLAWAIVVWSARLCQGERKIGTMELRPARAPQRLTGTRP